MARSTLPVRALVAIGTLGIAIGCASKSPSQQPAVPSTPRLEQAGGLAPNLIEVTVRAEKGLTPSPVKTLPPRDPSTIRRDKPHSYRLQSDQTQSFTSGTGTDPAWGGVLVTGNGGWNLNEIAGANWIWRTAAFDNGGAFTVTRTFDIPTGAMNIQGFVEAGFDDSGNVIVNGTDLGRGGDWNTASRMDVSALLHPGSNTVALAGQNGDCASCTTVQQNPAGVDGLVSVTWTGQAALTLSDPASTAPPDTSIAFSPNGDGSKDKISLNVTSPADWQVVVANPQLPGKFITLVKGSGQPTQQSVLWYDTPGNTPNPTVQKNNGTVLKDGVYTLHLTAKGATPGPSDATAIVTIDTVKPIVTATMVSEIDEGDDKVLSYTVAVQANDPGNASSGIDPASVVPQFKNASFSKIRDSKASTANDFEATADYLSAPSSANMLRYAVSVTDKAGNTSNPLESSFSFQSDVVYTASLDQASITSSGSSAYSLLAQRPRPTVEINSGDVYYEYSETKALLTTEYSVLSPGGIWKPFRGTRYLYVKDAFGVDVAKSKFGWVSNTPIFPSMKWNGRDYAGTLVPGGHYNLSVSEPEPWEVIDKGLRRVDRRPLQFKVSNKKCITIPEWSGQGPAYQTLDQKAHELDRHIVDPAQSSLPDRIFGKFDGTLLIAPRPTGFNEATDAAAGFPITTSILQNPAFRARYDAVLTFATAVAKSSVSVQDDPVSQYAPIVLRNGRVLWVRRVIDPAFSVLDPITRLFVPSTKTVYPFYTKQLQYENAL